MNGSTPTRWSGAHRLAGVAAALLVVLALAACRANPADPGTRSGGGVQGAVDPQVFDDVVEYIMAVPGEASQSRANRITNFANGVSMRWCGATPPPLDYVRQTGGLEYPSLEWIRERGLSPIYDPVAFYGLASDPYEQPEKPRCTDTSDAAMRKAHEEGTIPGRNKFVMTIAPSWDEMERTVENEPASVALKAPLANCLRSGSGLEVDPTDPYISWLLEVNKAYIRKKDPVSKDTMMKWSVLYADCATAYFDHVRERLTEERPALIERNREAIETFAATLVRLGYTP